MPNYEHYIQSRNYIKPLKKYTAEPAKVHLNSIMETIRNDSIMKNIGQIQNFRRNTGDLTIQNFRRNTGDLTNSKHNLKYNSTF